MSGEVRQCIRCGDPEESAILEHCPTCGKRFCADCVYRATGRRFCASECARAFFYGDSDDEEGYDDSAD